MARRARNRCLLSRMLRGSFIWVRTLPFHLLAYAQGQTKAASNTTTVALKTFILAMVCFPQVQERAQRELDKVLESGRLPNFSDVPSLPYISALVKEVLRCEMQIFTSND